MSPTEPMAKRHLGSHDNGIEPTTEIKSSIGEDEPRQLYISGIGIHNMRISNRGHLHARRICPRFRHLAPRQFHCLATSPLQCLLQCAQLHSGAHGTGTVILSHPGGAPLHMQHHMALINWPIKAAPKVNGMRISARLLHDGSMPVLEVQIRPSLNGLTSRAAPRW